MESYPALYIPASDLLASLPRDTATPFVVGRSTRANLCVPDVAWSRELFAIQVDPGACILEQLSQKAPTLLNGTRVIRGVACGMATRLRSVPPRWSSSIARIRTQYRKRRTRVRRK